MLTRILSFKLLLFVCLVSVACQKKDETGQSPLDTRLLGKWNVISKTNTKKTGNQETEREQELYDKGEKTYEFTYNNRLVIESKGQLQVMLPVWMEGGKLFIGQDHPDKEPYTITFPGNRAILVS
ncbi:hypothetical protein [Pontibacter ruber]|uniref:Lipocalin-like domain-containing protein n=1 Tax=Pontibacter ruber TaxID=1343895 RepID=A0ABW5CYV6_9BACT|nr:hypothetical protein [Pontibacter ruber]